MRRAVLFALAPIGLYHSPPLPCLLPVSGPFNGLIASTYFYRLPIPELCFAHIVPIKALPYRLFMPLSRSASPDKVQHLSYVGRSKTKLFVYGPQFIVRPPFYPGAYDKMEKTTPN